jgi:hypothetical protein
VVFAIIEFLRFILTQEDLMTETPAVAAGPRRDEDIALDLMKFVAMTTGYGRTSSPVGFQGGSSPDKPEDYAHHLLELYGKCLRTIQEGQSR